MKAICKSPNLPMPSVAPVTTAHSPSLATFTGDLTYWTKPKHFFHTKLKVGRKNMKTKNKTSNSTGTEKFQDREGLCLGQVETQPGQKIHGQRLPYQLKEGHFLSL
jgi:hypothetical protein